MTLQTVVPALRKSGRPIRYLHLRGDSHRLDPS